MWPPACSPPCMGKPPPALAHASSRADTAAAPPAPTAAARPPACPQHRRCCQQAGAVSCTLTPSGLIPGVNRQACTHKHGAPGAGVQAVTRRAEQPSALPPCSDGSLLVSTQGTAFRRGICTHALLQVAVAFLLAKGCC